MILFLIRKLLEYPYKAITALAGLIVFALLDILYSNIVLNLIAFSFMIILTALIAYRVYSSMWEIKNTQKGLFWFMFVWTTGILIGWLIFIYWLIKDNIYYG